MPLPRYVRVAWAGTAGEHRDRGQVADLSFLLGPPQQVIGAPLRCQRL